MIRVMHVTGAMNRAGQETLIMNIFRNIDRSRFRLEFLCLSEAHGDYDEEIYALGGKIHHIPRQNVRNWFTRRRVVVRENIRFFSQHQDIILHIHEWSAYNAFLIASSAKKAGVKHIIVHSHNTSNPRRWLSNLFRGKLNRLNPVRLACSGAAGAWLFGKKQPVKVIHNGIELEKFRFDPVARAHWRERLGVEGLTVIGHVGRLSHQKNHSFLLNVFSAYQQLNPESVLLLVGVGELKAEVEQKVLDLSLSGKVRFLGVTDSVHKLLNAFDIFVFPSLYEGLPVVLVETQENALGIVQSDIITPTVVFSSKVVSLPLSAPMGEWVSALDRLLKADRGSADFSDNRHNFDVLKSVAALVDIYEKFAEGKPWPSA